MAVKLSVGLQQKVGQPDYGSLGASCYLEFEIDRSLLESDRDGFQQQVRSAFAACQKSVNDQLAQQSGHSSSNGNGHAGNNSSRNGHSHTNGNGNGARQEVSSATQSQVRAIFAIARRQQVDPATVARERFNVERPEDLSIREASTLIDELKSAQTGVSR